MSGTRHLMAVAAHLLLRNRDGQILYLRRCAGFGAGCWSVPAGHLERGETAAEACAREAQEEVGVRLDPGSLNFVLVQHKRDTDGEERIDLFFEAALPADQSVTNCEPDKVNAIEWGAAQQPRPGTVAYVATALTHIASGSGQLSYFGFR